MYKVSEIESDSGVKNTSIVRVEDGACIPTDPSNTDYQAYLKWLEEGNTVLSADE